MSFKNQHPDYKSYSSNLFYVNEFPDAFKRALEGFIVRACNNESNRLKYIINRIAGIIPMEVTECWSWDYLLNDLKYYIRKLAESDFYKTMDIISELYEGSSNITLDDLNEFLKQQNIGYILRGVNQWDIRKDVEIKTGNLDSAILKVSDICEQTMLHLEQAKNHIIQNNSDRGRKDAVRDCLSAMEALLKQITNTQEIGDATKKLKSDPEYGPDFIVKDGLSIWDRIHRNYPDIRHGSPKVTDLSEEECLYWVNRINCFIDYICKIYRK